MSKIKNMSKTKNMKNKKISKILPKLFVGAVILSLITVLWPATKLKAYDSETSTNGDIRITVTAESPSNLSQIGKSATNVNFLKIKVENLNTTSSYLWSNLIVTYTGQASADIATDGVNLHLDDGVEGFNPTNDVMIFERSLSAGRAEFGMTGSNVTINASSTKTYFVSLDMAAAPINNDTVGVRIDEDDMTFINQTTDVHVTDLPQAQRDGPTGHIDSQVPTITLAETGDRDADGKIDYYKITFSENIDDSSINGYTTSTAAISGEGTHGFSVADYAGETIYLGTSAVAAGLPADTNDDNILYLSFTEGSADTDAKPQLTYIAATGLLTDLAYPANALANIIDGGLTETDKAAPVLISAASTNILQAGNVKAASAITLTFSESVTATSAAFTLTTKRDGSETPVAYTQASFDGTTASIDNGSATTRTLTIAATTTGSNPAFTMGESQKQGYWTTGAQFKFAAVGAGTIKDAANLDVNTSGAYVSLSAEDGTAPVTVKVVGYDDGSLSGTANDGKLDKIEMYFNEALTSDTYEITDFTTLTVNNGAGAQTLTLTSAARDATTNNLVVLDLDATVSGTGAIILKYKDNTDAGGHDIADVSANKYSATAEKTPATTDAVKPIIVAVANYDVDTDGGAAAANGKNDEILITFSENVDDSSFATGTDITVNGIGVKYEAPASTQNTGDTGNAADDYLLTVVNNTQADEFTGTDRVAVVILGSGISDLASPANANISQTFAADATGNSDKADPVMLLAETGDADSDGLIDHYKLTFSENIDDSTILGYTAVNADIAVDCTVPEAGEMCIAAVNTNGGGTETYKFGTGLAAFLSTADVDADDEIIYITFTEGTGNDLTTGDKPQLTYTNSNTKFAGLTDNSGTELQTIADGTVAETDKAAPVMMIYAGGATEDGKTEDTDPNGYLDDVLVQFSEPITITGLVAGDITIKEGATPSAGTTSTISSFTTAAAVGTKKATTAAGSVLKIVLSDNTGGTDAVGIQMNVLTHIVDANSNQMSSTASDGGAVSGLLTNIVNDAAAPVAMSAVYKDSNNDAKVDKVEITFSEIVTLDEYEDDDWAVTDPGTIVLADETLAAAATNVITLTALGNADITGGTDPTVSYTAAAGIQPNSVNDGANNTAGFAIAAADSAAPVLISAASTNILQAGNILTGSTVILTFSENMTATSAAFTLKVRRDGSETAQTYTSSSTIFDGATASIGNDLGGDANLTLTITGTTTGSNTANYTMYESQTQGYWTNGADLYFSAATGIADQASSLNNLNTVPTTGISINAEDGTAPTAILMKAVDGGDGYIDTIEVYFNEALDDSGDITDADITLLKVNDGTADQTISDDIASADVVTDGTKSTNKFLITLDGAHEAGTDALKITYNDGNDADNTSIRDDSSANKLWSGGVDKTQASITSVLDAVAPILLSAETGDNDADGKIDNYKLTFSENIDVSELTANASNTFDVASYSGEKVCFDAAGTDCDPAGNADTNVLYLVFTEGGSADTSAKPDLTYSGSTVKDTATSPNSLAAIAAFTETDKAAPVPVTVASSALVGTDGKVIAGTTFTITFSENITGVAANFEAYGTEADKEFLIKTRASGGTDVTTATNFYDDNSGLLVGHVTFGANTMIITWTGQKSKVADWRNTATFNLIAGKVVADEIKDTGDNPAVPNTTDITISNIYDSTPPTIASIKTNDSSGDGQIDQIIVQFNETMNSARTATTNWTVTTPTYTIGGAGTYSTTTYAGDTFTMTLTPSGSADTNATPSVSYTQPGDGFEDAAGNDLGSASSAATDTAKPAIVSATTNDNNANGKIDRLVLVFSENVTLVDGSAGDSLDSIALSGGYSITNGNYAISATNTVTLTITEGGSADTNATINPTYTTGHTNTIKDESVDANEMANNETVAGTDGAKPVIIAVANYDNATADGTNDQVYITFSEALEANATLATHLGTVTYGGSTGTISLLTTLPALHGQTDADNDKYITLEQNNDTGGFGNTDTNQLVFAGATIADRVSPANTFTAQTVSATGDTVATVTDAAIPVLMSSSCTDTEPDGKINTCTLTYSETLTTQAVTTVSAKGRADGDVTVSSAAASGTNVTVTLANADTDNWTGVIKITYTAGNGIADGTNNAASLADEVLTDDVVPVLLSSTMTDTGANGTVDTITLTYSENLTTTTGTVITAKNKTSSSTIDVTSTTIPGSAATLTVNLNASDPDNYTGVIQLTYDNTQTNKIKDAAAPANNAASFADYDVTDNVAPALMSAAPSNGGTITAVFSEPLLASTVERTDFDITGIEGNIVRAATSSSNASNVIITLPTEVNAWALVGQTFSLLATKTVTDAVPNTLTGPKSVTIGSATTSLVSIDVIPSTATIRKNDTQQFTAVGHYSDNSTSSLTSSATWFSSKTSVATIDASGLATGVLENQSTVITATKDGVSGTATLTVTSATLSSIVVTPASPANLPIGSTQQFQATGIWSDNSTSTITSNAYWQSSTTSVATIDANTGLATGVATGTTGITATKDNKTSTAVTLTVASKTLASITVTPTTPTVTKGSTVTFVATGTYSDGSTSTLTGSIWSSADTSVADTPNSNGTTTALKVGSTEIKATSGSISGSTVLTVFSADLSSIAITPATATVVKGTTQQFVVTGTYSDGNTQVITPGASWTSSSSTIATINANGLATTQAESGTTTITADVLGKTATAVITASAKTVSSVTVTPALPTIAKGTTQQFVAVATYSDGSTTTVTDSAAWVSSNVAAATINATSGLAAAVAQGSTEITATYESKSGTATLTIGTSIWTGIEITAIDDQTASLPIGDWQVFQAWGIKSDISREDITDRAEWISSATSVASFGDSFWGEELHAEEVGTTSVTAKLDGMTSNAIAVTVTGASATPTVTAPATTTTVTSNSYTITGTSTASADIYIYNSNWSYGTADGSGNWSVEVNLNSGANNFRVYAQESGKAPSASVGVPTITQDSQSPNVRIISPTGGDIGTVTPELVYDIDDGTATIVVKVDEEEVGTRSGQFFAELALGSHTVIVEATDLAGNTGSSDVNFNINLSVPGFPEADYPSGVYNATFTVSLMNGNAYYYTTDDSNPSTSSAVYTADGIEITDDTVLKARSIGSNDILGPVATFTYILKTDLAGPSTQTIVLKNGKWNIFSVPKVVDSFTANTSSTQTTLTGLVSKLGTSSAAFLLEGSVWKNLVSDAIANSSNAHYHLEVPQPLYGYVIYNNSGNDITLTITYKTSLGIGENLFDRPLAAGWNSVGVADYQGALPADSTFEMNIDTSDGIGGMSPGYILDYTANANDNSVNFAGAARLRTADSDQRTNIINLRETRGYMIFISQDSRMGGSQL
jgi:hypothetical protein